MSNADRDEVRTAEVIAALSLATVAIPRRPLVRCRRVGWIGSTAWRTGVLRQEAQAGRLDGESVAAVLEAAGHRVTAIARESGLTEREAELVTLLARGLQTRQIARVLSISARTADRHIQNAYTKMCVSTRAAAALFAMRYGLAGWGELPMVGAGGRS